MRALDVLLLEDPRVGTAEEGRSDLLAEHVPHLVAGDGGDEASDEQHGQVEPELSLRREEPGGEQQ
jgi:hypothetical protein